MLQFHFILVSAPDVGADVYLDLPEHWRQDREVALAAARADGYVLNAGYHDRPRLPVEFRNDREIVLTCLQHRNASGWLFEYASEELKATREVVLAVVQNHGQALRYASAVLRDDEEIVEAAMREDDSVLEYAGEKCLCF